MDGLRNVKTGYRGSIAFKIIAGIVSLLIVFSLIIGIVGYNNFTSTMVELYFDSAFRTADAAADLVDGDDIDLFMENGPDTYDYLRVHNQLRRLCNSTGSTFIYVIVPDRPDYDHITFIFSTMKNGLGYQEYDYGYYRKTTNDDYRTKYRKLYEEGSEREEVVRDKGEIETDKHITAMIPLKGEDGSTKAILCVQLQLDYLARQRLSYINRVILVLILLAIAVMLVQSLYLHNTLLDPMRRISEEARRFAVDNIYTDTKLTDTIHNRDEIGILASSIDQMEDQIRDYIDNITEATKEKERINTELTLATRIQEAMLPNNFPDYPDRQKYDVYASMTPAKEVGGDFYDFFKIDADHLGLVIADVSGKGIPAALFMMVAKALIKTQTMTGQSPAEVLRKINDQICSNNGEEMFVTVWLGVLDLKTGLLKACNAGHEYPIIKRPGGEFELFKDKHGLVIGGLPGVVYKDYEIQMEPGTKVFVYTDGLLEETSPEEEFFGIDRAIAVLNEHKDKSLEQIIGSVKEAAEDFAGGITQFDDLTMLCIEYKGIGDDTDIK